MIFRLRRARIGVAVLVVLSCCLVPSIRGDEAPASGGQAQIVGRVVGADGKELAGATVLAYHLSSERSFTSAPTDASGQYALTGLPYGYFDVAVSTADGLFVADIVVNVPPSGKTTVVLALGSSRPDEAAPRAFPGTDAKPVGMAKVQRRLGGGRFWRSGKGIGILAGVGGAALLAIASDDDEAQASPSAP